MSAWLIEPRDPLVVRDGRPNDGRSESAMLPFPLPSTCAGVCRTRIGSDPGRGFVLGERLDELRKTSLRGPLLADEDTGNLFFPRPFDVRVEATDDGAAEVQTIAPLPAAGGVRHDGAEDLLLVGVPADGRISRKPFHDAPVFWPWSWIERGLRGPLTLNGDEAKSLVGAGLAALPAETRVHLALDRDTETASEGMLFGTTGLRFVAGRADALSSARRLALFFDFESRAVPDRALSHGIAPFGGKRRLARWTRAEAARLPEIPAWLSKRVEDAPIDAALRLRVLIATPGVFEDGYRPRNGASPILPESGIASLVAALVPYPETVSGWDFEKDRPKPSRRMVAAGSVFWVDLIGTKAQRLAWLKGVWMQNVSDDPQDRRDGFGLALVGVGS